MAGNFFHVIIFNKLAADSVVNVAMADVENQKVNGYVCNSGYYTNVPIIIHSWKLSIFQKRNDNVTRVHD